MIIQYRKKNQKYYSSAANRWRFTRPRRRRTKSPRKSFRLKRSRSTPFIMIGFTAINQRLVAPRLCAACSRPGTINIHNNTIIHIFINIKQIYFDFCYRLVVFYNFVKFIFNILATSNVFTLVLNFFLDLLLYVNRLQF